MSAENNPQYTCERYQFRLNPKKKDKKGWDHNLVSVNHKVSDINFITDGNN
jgi:hypothetical protein